MTQAFIVPSDAEGLRRLMQQADADMAAGRLADAEAALRAGLQFAPINPACLRRLSQIAAHRAQWAAARDWAERAIAAGRDPWSHNQLGAVHLLAGELDAAEVAMQRMLSIFPNHVAALRRLSEIALRRGDPASAITWARRAAAAQPTHPGPLYQLSTAQIAAGDLDAAQATTEQSLTLVPGHAPALRRLSDIALRRADQPGALVWAEKVVDAHPDDPWSHFQLATVRMAGGEFKEAEAATLRMLARAPGHVAALRRLSDIALRRGDTATALSWARAAVEAAPENPGTHYQ
ncbi:MAG TPA: tetratricopeptide repeat protein, partial [Roseomonas sp.]